MIISKTVQMKPTGRSVKRFKELGYVLDGNVIDINVEHLSKGSGAMVDAKCHSCGKVRAIKFCEYKDYCLDCTRKSFKGDKNPAWKGGKNTCKKCGDETSGWTQDVCGKCHLTREQSGENNHQWKGGKPNCECGEPVSDWRNSECRKCFILRTKKEETNKRQRNKAHKTLVKNVLSRDDYTCNYCSKKNGDKLEVHHLKGWSANKDVRFDPSNCVTLCKSCHKTFHKTYGFGDNTPEQYLKFKEEKL